jgi:rubredoxin
MAFYPKTETLMPSTEVTVFRTYMCLLCGFIYDEENGLPDQGIAAGTRWDDVPINWTCPDCGARKNEFEMVEI